MTEQRLAELIVDAAARRQRGETVPNRSDEVARLVVELGAQGDEAFGRFLQALVQRLAATGTRLPPIDQLPPSVAPLLQLFEEAFVTDADGELDPERTAAQLDAMVKAATGTSPREVRAAQLEAEIRSDISTSVADTLRKHGLVPAADADKERD